MNRPRRIFRKNEQTPEERDAEQVVHETFSRDRPTHEDLMASGDYDGPLNQGAILALLSALGRIKQERERRGLTLADVAEGSGLDKGMLSRLENGKILNPTMSTLWRYARAVDVELRLDTHAIAGVFQSAPGD